MKKSAASSFLVAAAILITSCGGGADTPLAPASPGTGSASGAPTQTAPAAPPATLYVVTYGGSKLHAFHLDDNGLKTFPNSPFFVIGSPWTALLTPQKTGLLMNHFSGNQSVAYVALGADGIPGATIDHVLPDDAFVGKSLLFHPSGKFVYGFSYAEPAVRVFVVNGAGSYTEDVAAKFSLGADCPQNGTYTFQALGVSSDGSLVTTTNCTGAITVLATDPQTGRIVSRTDQPLSNLVRPSPMTGDYLLATGMIAGENKSRTRLWQVKAGELNELAACDCATQTAVAVGAAGGLGVESDGTTVSLVRDGATLVEKKSSVKINSPYDWGMQITGDGRFLIVLSDVPYGSSGYLNVLKIGSNGDLAHVQGSPFETGWLSTDAVADVK
jgi:hypothetical protein